MLALQNIRLKLSTRQKYSKAIKYFCEFVLANQLIPGRDGQTICLKYGNIGQPVNLYNAPAREPDDDSSEIERTALTKEQRDAFLSFICNQYLREARKPNAAFRDFVMILIATFTGLRNVEIRHLRAKGPTRDIDYETGMIRTHMGKATKCKGKRTRWSILPFVIHPVLKLYEDEVLPLFAEGGEAVELFLSEGGKILSYKATWRNLNRIVDAARDVGLDLPEKLRWHDLRRTFATLFIEENPDKFWLLMEYMGHIFGTTMARYIVTGKEMKVRETMKIHERRLNRIHLVREAA
jgi:integrase